MGQASSPGRCHVDLARVGFGVANELWNTFCRKQWIDGHDKRDIANACDGRDVADEIEFEILVERGVYRVRRSGTEERVAIRGRVHERLGRDSAGGVRPVLDDDLLTEPLRQPLTHQRAAMSGPLPEGKPT